MKATRENRRWPQKTAADMQCVAQKREESGMNEKTLALEW
jgi:hypothetical protein